MGELVNGRSKYSDDKRRQAVVEYCVNGLMTKVSESTGIPETTLATWKNKTVWWDDLVVSVRSEINDRILANNLEIATKAGERVLDSLENGDEVPPHRAGFDRHAIYEYRRSVQPRHRHDATRHVLVAAADRDQAVKSLCRDDGLDRVGDDLPGNK